MKNVPESVIAELRQLSGKIRTLCIENNMPCVVSYARDCDEKSVSRTLVAYTDSETGAYDRPIAAATILLKMDEVPEELISLLKLMECKELVTDAFCSMKKESLH
ncbi:hypothetical protein JG310_000478 [Salmonella enterica subsp. enterica serovar Reading]|nr:hypothetical protein [Salmonella enterica subsp. enterica serovar Reading]ECI2685633.1 hypothetical protein [Salmonella enterica subsp. enterica]EDU8832111.1 hypothetical protein [Salmonella enterica subsp. enterica]EEL6674695.1 hypothetical protein [Salmonella enterica subsp. enterica serovar Reading]EGI6131663.1 hypothetical protein [Salmonella enterica subsp. enterica serovar Reading]